MEGLQILLVELTQHRVESAPTAGALDRAQPTVASPREGADPSRGLAADGEPLQGPATKARRWSVNEGDRNEDQD